MASLTLKNISKKYGDTAIIHAANMRINDGEFVVFVGPSGCGKSTLLRMIAGLEDISGGDLYIGDARMNDVGPGERGVAMVFQSYALYPHMTAYENISFGLRMAAKMPADEIDRRVRSAAAALQLGSLLGRLPRELSGGQRQRVAIGRAIVREPQVFLLDEPLSNLDAELRAQMRVELRGLHRRLAATMIYVTHDQVEAMTLAQRIIVLNGGRIEQAGAPMEIYRYPRNQFVAGFIGSPKMNFLPAQVVSAEGATYTLRLPTLNNATLTLPQSEWDLRAGQAVTVGARPNTILPISAADSAGSTAGSTAGSAGVSSSGSAGSSVGSAGVSGSGDNIIPGAARFDLEVDAGERLGDTTFLYCKIDNSATSDSIGSSGVDSDSIGSGGGVSGDGVDSVSGVSGGGVSGDGGGVVSGDGGGGVSGDGGGGVSGDGGGSILVETEGDMAVSPGARLALQLPPAAVHLFAATAPHPTLRRQSPAD